MAGPARVFISYSNKDTDLVNRLKSALAEAGVAVWLDHEQLTPGTRNWQIKVREGIAWATHMVYAASETAALSDYVHDEINIARDKGKTVIPFWIRGNYWHDCVPLGFGATQYIDGRDAAYAGGLAKLLTTLGVASPALQQVPLLVSEPEANREHLGPSYDDLTYEEVLQLARGLIGESADSQQRQHPPPDVPKRLASLGFRGVNLTGTPAIIPPLVEIDAGPFLMGSDKNRDPRTEYDETPQLQVEIAAFRIGKYPVTVAEYALAVNAGAVREPPVYKSGRLRGHTPVGGAREDDGTTWQAQLQRLDHPVVCVSWQDAIAYIIWLCKATEELGWRLPTEAQWEKAARWDVRTQVSRIYPWGDTFDKARCNTIESGLHVIATVPVGSYPASDARRSGASPWDAEDMAGNVWEWTSSRHKLYPYNPTDGRESQISGADDRVRRGGSWDDFASDARAAYRRHTMWTVATGERTFSNSTGFRLVLAHASDGN